MIFLGLDLNCASSICDPARNSLVGGMDELGQTGVRASHTAFAADHVSPLRDALWRSAQGQELFLSRPIPLHGIRSTDLSRQFARHRSLPARATEQALPHGHQEPGFAQHSGRCQRESRLAHLCGLCQSLIAIARRLYAAEPFGVDLKDTIDLCLSVFAWAPFRSTKAAIKLHTLLDLRGNIPSFLHISDGKLHDVNVLDLLLPEPGAFYIMDRGYIDFERLYRLHEAKSFFVTRAKSNLKAQRRYSHPVDRSTGLICDQTIVLSGFYSRQDFDTPLRRVRFKDPTTGKRLVFLTNNFTLPAFTITELYRCRWQVELFFKWIKQHLRIKVFFGTSENAVKTQIWIVVSVYVLVAIVKKRLNLSASLYEMLQILSLTMFERIPLDQLLNKIIADDIQSFSPNQLNLFN
jgi:hypothetical protein